MDSSIIDASAATPDTSLLERYHHAIAQLETATITPKNYMQSVDPQNQQFFLDRCQRFFDRLGNPEHGLKVVHIAGTSGKGSTSTMVYEAMRAADWNVGIYKSPYVTTAIENIEANGLLIDPESFIRLIGHVLPIVEEIRATKPEQLPSYAEVFFGIAMLYFQEQKVEWLVLEVGAGGRFDKTNIIPAPVAVGLTPIGYDHTDLLGDTLEQIAWHKAGVIKSGTLVFSNETNPTVQAVFNAEAAAHETHVQYVQTDLSDAELKPTTPYKTAMPGAHQQQNAALAAAIANAIHIPQEAITQGIAHAKLPARTEWMNHTQKSDSHTPRVLIDGAHSEPKMLALREVLDTVRAEEPWKKLILVFAAKEDKYPEALITPVADLVDELILSAFTLPGFSSHTPEQLRSYWQNIRPELSSHISLEPAPLAAIQQALALADPEDLVVVTGSLYLAGMIREHWISEEQILNARSVFPANLR